MPDDPAQLFEDMANRIRRNDPGEFAGCMLIVPPSSQDGRTGEPIELLLIDPKRDAVNFWSTAKSKTAIAADEFVQQHNVPPLGQWSR
jgi:hypothetical protein